MCSNSMYFKRKYLFLYKEYQEFQGHGLVDLISLVSFYGFDLSIHLTWIKNITRFKSTCLVV